MVLEVLKKTAGTAAALSGISSFPAASHHPAAEQAAGREGDRGLRSSRDPAEIRPQGGGMRRPLMPAAEKEGWASM